MNRAAPYRWVAGFTLVEMLAVLAIIGLLMTLGIPTYFRWIATNEVTNAAQTLTQEVARVRTQVKRRDAPITLIVTDGGSSVVSDRTVSMPLSSVAGGLTLTFVPPYGTLASGTATPQSVTVRSTRNASVSRQVSVVSLFGKTVVR